MRDDVKDRVKGGGMKPMRRSVDWGRYRGAVRVSGVFEKLVLPKVQPTWKQRNWGVYKK
jgi:hypothetical protein